jgi:hypothetical protein
MLQVSEGQGTVSRCDARREQIGVEAVERGGIGGQG